jgi:hypothetical protein
MIYDLQIIGDRYILQCRPIVIIIDETGDKKKGNTTDYVKLKSSIKKDNAAGIEFKKN